MCTYFKTSSVQKWFGTIQSVKNKFGKNRSVENKSSKKRSVENKFGKKNGRSKTIISWSKTGSVMIEFGIIKTVKTDSV